MSKPANIALLCVSHLCRSSLKGSSCFASSYQNVCACETLFNISVVKLRFESWDQTDLDKCALLASPLVWANPRLDVEDDGHWCLHSGLERPKMLLCNRAASLHVTTGQGRTTDDLQTLSRSLLRNVRLRGAVWVCACVTRAVSAGRLARSCHDSCWTV